MAGIEEKDSSSLWKWEPKVLRCCSLQKRMKHLAKRSRDRRWWHWSPAVSKPFHGAQFQHTVRNFFLWPRCFSTTGYQRCSEGEHTCTHAYACTHAHVHTHIWFKNAFTICDSIYMQVKSQQPTADEFLNRKVNMWHPPEVLECTSSCFHFVRAFNRCPLNTKWVLGFLNLACAQARKATATPMLMVRASTGQN